MSLLSAWLVRRFWVCSGRKNVLRKLLRIPYRRLKAGFSVCWLCLFVAGVLSEMHEVRSLVPSRPRRFRMWRHLSSLSGKFAIALGSKPPLVTRIARIGPGYEAARCKAFLFDMFAFFSSHENYFGFRTTNVKGKKDHSVSLRWNKRFWTFLKRRVFFWLCIWLIYELISPGSVKTRLYSVISSYGYFFYIPRFITFAEPALSLSSVKESDCCYNASE